MAAVAEPLRLVIEPELTSFLTLAVVGVAGAATYALWSGRCFHPPGAIGTLVVRTVPPLGKLQARIPSLGNRPAGSTPSIPIPSPAAEVTEPEPASRA